MSQIESAFKNPVHDAQSVFRILMDAMSRPGIELYFDTDVSFGTATSAATQILLTLADAATPLWLSNRFMDDQTLRANLTFHCAVPITEERENATFAFAKASEIEDLKGFASGDESYPDRSTTVIIDLESPSENKLTPLQLNDVTLRLKGPGVNGSNTSYLSGLYASLLESIVLSRAEFPLGIDLIFCRGKHVFAIPRSTQIDIEQVKEAVCTSL